MSKLLLALCLLGLVPALVSAQVTIESIELAGGLSAFGGDDFGDLEAGPRFQLSLYAPATPALAIGVTGTYGRGGIDGLDPSYQEIGIGGTVRHRFVGEEGDVGAYLGAYLGWIRVSVDLPPKIDANGVMLGPVAGIDFPLGGVTLFVGGEMLWLTTGDFRIAEGLGVGIGSGGEKGWRYGGEVGLRIAP